MVVLEQHPDGMHLVERRPTEPVAVAGVLFLALGLLPVLSDGPVTPLRALTALSLALGAALCFRLGRPRERRRALPDRAHAERLVLSGSSAIEGYSVLAVDPAGRRRVLLSGADPGRVLADALLLERHLGVPLETGWGLEEDALRLLRTPTGAPPLARTLVVQHRFVPDQAIGAGTALWAAAFIPGTTVVMALMPRSHLTPSALALVLPGLTALFALIVGLRLLGLRETLTVDGGRITRTRHWFGRPLGVGAETTGVIGLFAVGPVTGASLHLLAATSAGPVAFPTDRWAGRSLPRHSGAEERTAGRAAE